MNQLEIRQLCARHNIEFTSSGFNRYSEFVNEQDMFALVKEVEETERANVVENIIEMLKAKKEQTDSITLSVDLDYVVALIRNLYE